jgi:hypothetical protein
MLVGEPGRFAALGDRACPRLDMPDFFSLRKNRPTSISVIIITATTAAIVTNPSSTN